MLRLLRLLKYYAYTKAESYRLYFITMMMKIIIVTVTVFAVAMVDFNSLSSFKRYLDNILVAELPCS